MQPFPTTNAMELVLCLAAMITLTGALIATTVGLLLSRDGEKAEGPKKAPSECQI